MGSETLTLSGVGTVADANVGTNKAVTLGSLALGDGTGLASNYTLTGGTHTATITAAPLTLSAVTDSKVYDGTVTSVGAVSIVGTLFGSDTVSGETQAFGSKNVLGANGSTLSVTGYTINDGNGGLNYTVTTNTAAGTITPLGVIVTADAAQTRVYGDPDALTYTVNSLVGGDTNATAFTGSLGRAVGEDVGTYAIDSSGTLASTNYTITSFIFGDLTITPALLTVTADATNKILNTADPLLTYMVSGLKFTDTAATTLSGELARAAGETVGTYQINQGFLSLTSGNYTMNYVPANFTILVPTVIDEIVNTSLLFGPDTGSAQSTSSSEEDKAKEEILADADTKPVEGTAGQPLPVCN
jgi:hypothetical protein